MVYEIGEKASATARKELLRRFGLRVEDVSLEEGILFDPEELDATILTSPAEYDEWVRHCFPDDYGTADLLMAAFIRNVILATMEERLSGEKDLSEHQVALLKASYNWVEERFQQGIKGDQTGG